MSDPTKRSVELIEDQALSRLGLGAWAFGQTGWGPQDDRDSRRAILRAVELGVTWIDTAAVYGNGHSEELVGRVVREIPEVERPLIFTKCGLKVDSATGRTFRDLNPASLRAECDSSLRRLGVDRIDLYQLHWPVQTVAVVEEAWATLGDLQQQGKVRFTGVSNFDVALLDGCSSARPIDTAQVPLSLLSRDAGRACLPWAADHGVQVLAYSPLESGLLSGRFGRQRLRSLPPGDWRRQREQFQQPQLDRTLTLVERLRPIAARLGASIPELAIAWALAWRGVAGAIVGGRTQGQVESWIGAPELELDDAILAEIAARLTETNTGDGPASPTRQA